MKKTTRILAFVFMATFVLVAVFAYMYRAAIRDFFYRAARPALPVAEPYQHPLSEDGSVVSSTPSVTDTDTITETDTDPYPDKRLAVPFMSQAPHANWDMPYQEACEEASILMVAGYYRGDRGAYDPDEADRMILDLIDFEEGSLGYPADVTVEEAAKTVEAYDEGLSAEVLPVTDAEDIKRLIAQGIPVIVPADGKTLPNPNFRNGGPVYHMLVVVGYADGKFITNDPGTRLGESFLYNEEDLFASIHDWNGGDVPNGDKVMLVIKPKSSL